MDYEIEVAGLKRSLKLCPISQDINIAAFIIIGDQELTVKSAEALLKIAPEYDYLLSAEAKGIPLIHEMAQPARRQRVHGGPQGNQTLHG